MLPTFTCQRCGHTWIPRRNVKPSICPKCKSKAWDKPKLRLRWKIKNYVNKGYYGAAATEQGNLLEGPANSKEELLPRLKQREDAYFKGKAEARPSR